MVSRFTVPHNPTGTTLTPAELREVIALVEERGCCLLVDETYREMAFGEPLPMAADLSERAISVSSLSKTYRLPGIRIGWPLTRDRALMEVLLAAKEQIMICNSVVDEEIAHRFLGTQKERLPAIRQGIRERFTLTRSWLDAQPDLEWIEPAAGVACFPRVRVGSSVDIERFYGVLNDRYRTFVGPGHWFEMDRRYMRIGFGWPLRAELEEGLTCIFHALQESGR